VLDKSVESANLSTLTMPYKNREDKQKFQREWIAKRKAEFFKDKICAKCDSNYDLQLDHIDRTIKTSHRIWSWSEEKRNEELKKCQVLCSKCHKIKTKIDLGWK
jgi:5-methylcytosine-specific restriction endonuclease McrA